MRKLLIFLLSIVFLTYAVWYLLALDSRITGEAFGYKFDGSSGIILGGLLLFFLLTIYLTHKIKDIMALPGKIREREAEAHRTRGMAALTRGLEAVAVGDASAASHHAKIARRHLKDMSLTRLLSAQASQLSGDEAAAKESFSAMLEAPETEFMGLKGLYLQAMAKGDHAAAKDYAERAFRLRPNARWAFESVVDLGLERGAWGETRAAIEKARRNNIISEGKANRATAALLTADAYAAATSEDTDTALKETEAALKLAKGFSPAAVLAAKLLAESDKTGKAAKIIETAFEADAHPALIRSYDKLYTDEPAEKRASLLRKLADKNPSSREAALLRARAYNLEQNWADAIAALEPLLTGAPMAAEYALMATAASGLHGEEVGKGWLERAADAPLDPRPGADGSFHLTRDGWARLVREYMNHCRLAPPPLEDATAGIPAEELRLLTAPPEPEMEVEAADEPVSEVGEDAPITDSEDKKTTTDELASSVKQDEAPSDDDDHIHDDEDAERAAAAAREVS